MITTIAYNRIDANLIRKLKIYCIIKNKWGKVINAKVISKEFRNQDKKTN